MFSHKKNIILILLGVIAVSILLYLVFSGRLILPGQFGIGPLSVRYYGLFMALAVAGGFYLSMRRAPLYGISPQQAEHLLLWTAGGGFFGARLYHVLTELSYYSQFPADIVKVWHGGLSIYGAVLGGAAALFVAVKISEQKIEPLKTLDWLVPGLVLGQIIGRFGNLFNYELFGYPTGIPWKMYVPDILRPFEFAEHEFFHPLFLYESLAGAGILYLLLKVIKPRFSGQLFISYLFLYNIVRFFLEFMRIDSTIIWGVRFNAGVSLLLTAAALAVLLRKDGYNKAS